MTRLAVAALGCLAASPWTSPEAKLGLPPTAFSFCVSHGEPQDAREVIPSELVAHALYRQIPVDARVEFARALDDSVTRREARLNPLMVDFEEGDPDSALEPNLARSPAAFGAARALLRERACGSDGFCVHVRAGSCRAEEHRAQGRELDRARFLAWTYGYAKAVPASRSASSWREEPGVALVIESRAATAATEDPLERATILSMARRAVLMAAERNESFAETLPGAAWEPKEGELLIVPTLDQVAREMRGPDSLIASAAR